MLGQSYSLSFYIKSSSASNRLFLFACAELGVTESAMSPHLPFTHQPAGQAHWLLLPKPANDLLAHPWQERKAVLEHFC